MEQTSECGEKATVAGRARLATEETVALGLCAASLTGGIYSYARAASLMGLGAGLLLGGTYGASARMMQRGRLLDGVDLSILASAMALVVAGPRAYATRALPPMAIAGISAIALARMGYVSYGLRHGHRGS